ncbi:MAG: Hsp20/alpha crystallin family protein [Deltaproteobacteria bacterium]|nr:Hsp20/alpha crystallin family protein [Deltaproteobacteria bacterium]
MPFEKWNPLRELEVMKREMDRIWEDVFSTPRRVDIPWKKPPEKERGGVASPAIDILDRNEEVIVRAEMPGVVKEDIDVSMQENTLTIKGEIRDEMEKGGEFSYSERNYKYYSRSVNIPFKIQPDRIRAALKDGLLSIHIPKAMEVQPKKINVEIS